jgi:lysyl-tRNA synthetase class 2
VADNKNQAQPDVNEQIKVRMDKLAALQEAGKDPFQITKYDVTHHTDEIRAIYEAHEKELLGDRPEVNTDGMDEQQAREAVNADYNERRAIMDASPIEVSFAGRMMFKRVMGKASFCNTLLILRAECRHIYQEMLSVMMLMQILRSLI